MHVKAGTTNRTGLSASMGTTTSLPHRSTKSVCMSRDMFDQDIQGDFVDLCGSEVVVPMDAGKASPASRVSCVSALSGIASSRLLTTHVSVGSVESLAARTIPAFTELAMASRLQDELICLFC